MDRDADPDEGVLPPEAGAEEGDETEACCVVCQHALRDPESLPILTLPCGHRFHRACIQQWEQMQIRSFQGDDDGRGYTGYRCPLCVRHYLYLGDHDRTPIALAAPSPPRLWVVERDDERRRRRDAMRQRAADAAADETNEYAEHNLYAVLLLAGTIGLCFGSM